MKEKVIVMIVLLVMVIILFFIFKKSPEITTIKRLYFTYTNGYAINSYVIYELNCDDKCTVKIKPLGEDEENAKEYNVSKKDLERIEKVLKDNHVEKWNGFNKNDKNVLDGDSFNFYVKTKNGDTIEASGYMMWPKNYADVRNGLDSIFNKILEDNDIHTNN